MAEKPDKFKDGNENIVNVVTTEIIYTKPYKAGADGIAIAIALNSNNI